MQGVLAGFASLALVIALGFVLASLEILDESAQRVLTRTSF